MNSPHASPTKRTHLRRPSLRYHGPNRAVRAAPGGFWRYGAERRVAMKAGRTDREAVERERLGEADDAGPGGAGVERRGCAALAAVSLLAQPSQRGRVARDVPGARRGEPAAALGASRGMTVSAPWLSGSPTSSASSRAEIGVTDASVCMRPPWCGCGRSARVASGCDSRSHTPSYIRRQENRANQADATT